MLGKRLPLISGRLSESAEPPPICPRSIPRLTRRAASIVIVALSLGLWWAVWEAVFAAPRRPTWLELERAGPFPSRRETEVGFAADSLLEQTGFELLVLACRHLHPTCCRREMPE